MHPALSHHPSIPCNNTISQTNMKTAPQSSISLCLIILFSLYANSLLCAAADEPVLDEDGNEVLARGRYYVVSAIRGAGGGGLTVDTTGDETCPLTVVQEALDLRYGLPLSFHPANSEESVVRVSTNVNVKFEASIPCANSSVWRVGRFDAWSRTFFVQIEGEQGQPGCDWFKIEKVSEEGNIYKIVFDPSGVCSNPTAAENIGVVLNMERKRVLGLFRADPFRVVFRKVKPLHQAY